MFKRDLVAKYGKATKYYVSDRELRTALRERELVFGGGALLVIGGLVTAGILAPEVLASILLLLGIVAIFGGAFWLVIYFIDRFPDQLKVIRDAKKYGVYEVDEH